MKWLSFVLVALSWPLGSLVHGEEEGTRREPAPFVALAPMDMMILPGTQAYLEQVIATAGEEGAAAIVVQLDTPGGLLQSSQEMIQMIFASPVPVIMYVTPSGSTATSAGVFLTMAGHVAAMAPGTSIGAAHPVAGDGKDIEGDMRAKAENMTTAMVRSVAEQRGRNVAWAEEAVRKSASITEAQALELKVIDIVAPDLDALLRAVKGKKVQIQGQEVVLKDLSNLPRRTIEMSFRHRAVNFLADPNVAGLLWLIATTGITIELYNPGLVFPGVVGLIALVLALAATSVIPLNYGGIALLVVGAFMVGLELVVTSGVLGIGGAIAMILGAAYLFDEGLAPGLVFHEEAFMMLAGLFAAIIGFFVFKIAQAQKRKDYLGSSAMVGEVGRVVTALSPEGQIFLNGEVWKARAPQRALPIGADVKVVAVEGLLLIVEELPRT